MMCIACGCEVPATDEDTRVEQALTVVADEDEQTSAA